MYGDINPYEVIIDTDSYAGNFERELCAYVTGHWDDETHGGDQAEVFRNEIEEDNLFEDCIGSITNEFGLQTPVYLESTPAELAAKHVMSSIAIVFEKKPTPLLIHIIKSRAYKFEREGLIFGDPVKLKILGFRLRKITVNIEEEEL